MIYSLNSIQTLSNCAGPIVGDGAGASAGIGGHPCVDSVLDFLIE